MSARLPAPHCQTCGDKKVLDKLQHEVSVCRETFDILCGRAIYIFCPCMKAFCVAFSRKSDKYCTQTAGETTGEGFSSSARSAKFSSFPEKAAQKLQKTGYTKTLRLLRNHAYTKAFASLFTKSDRRRLKALPLKSTSSPKSSTKTFDKGKVRALLTQKAFDSGIS